MGLTSALSTALTGLSAAETTIDVVGNNVANSSTVGFKASEVSFATQFLQTLALGGAPAENSGGTNPQQLGLGTVVAAITPNFTQGTVEVSSSPTDMAIQGDGFFIVEGSTGEQVYTRTGTFKLNSEDELVTTTGNRLLGYGIDDDYQIQKTVLVPIEIPLGDTAVAQATQNAYLEGALSPTGDVADTGSIIQTSILGRDDHVYPETAVTTASAERPNLNNAGTSFTEEPAGSGSMMADDEFTYRIVYVQTNPMGTGDKESMWAEQAVTITADNTAVLIDNVPHDGGTTYDAVHIYRKDSSDADFHLAFSQDLDSADPWAFTDTRAVGYYSGTPAQNTDVLSGEYTYYVTFGKIGAEPDPDTNMMDPDQNSRPSPLTTSPVRVTNGRVVISDIPTTDASNEDLWDCRRIWRRDNSSDDASWHLVAEIPNVDDADAVIVDQMPDTGTEGAFAQPILDLDGPRIRSDTTLEHVTLRDSQTYENVFQAGTLEFTGEKGGRTLSTKDLVIDDGTTVQDLLTFMEEAMGIVSAVGSGTESDIPADASSGHQPGGYIDDGRLSLQGNGGVDNALDIGLSGMQLKTTAESANVDLPWQTTQAAVGESAVTDFVVYDSLGIPIQVRLTAVLQECGNSSTTYRWFADSSDNDPASTDDVSIAVGTGLITFDSEGNFVSASNSTVSIDRRHVASASPLEFDLDFSQISGLATDSSSLAVSRQDGSAAGTLTSFIVGEDGIIRGVFNNGAMRDLGQILLARFANPAGLEQRGQNLFSEGVNSGLAVIGSPGERGVGSIVAGAVELSNTDIGGDLVRLILASTMYRGNARVITTSQEMLDELLALRR